MQLFYDPNITAGLHTLSEAEARHAVQVLRRREGDVLDLVDGRGGWFRGVIRETGKKRCLLDVSPVRTEPSRLPFRRILAVAPPKSGDRFEWLLEKATEIGVDAIQPMICHHSERRKLRPERLEKVLETAMKQSYQAWLPDLLPIKPFEEVVRESKTAGKYLAWVNERQQIHLASVYQSGEDATILIGPEGGFSGAEAQRAVDLGFLPVSLGPNRLRTETAGVVAVHLMSFT